LKFKGYAYDWLSAKLIEVHVEISQRILFVQPTFAGLSSRNELVMTTMKELVLNRGGAEITIVSCILFLTIKLVEVFVVVVST